MMLKLFAVAGAALGLVTGGAPPAGSAETPADGLEWRSCRLGPDDELGKELEEAGAKCAKVAVPLDHAEPNGRTIEVAISRIPATDPAQRRGILLANPGGPGGPGLDHPMQLRSLLGDNAGRYDLIGFDPRFVGRSNPISCGPVRPADVFRSAGVDRAGFQESARFARDFAVRCQARNGDLLRYAGIREAARDLDAIRAALGEQKLSYYGVSWGADLGAIYSQLFPGRVDRMVIDSVTDVEGSEYHHLRTGERSEAALDEWAAWAGWRHAQYGLGRTGAQVRATVTRLQQTAARTPIRIGQHRVDDNALPFVLRTWLGDASDYPALAQTVRTLHAAAAGKPTKPSQELTEFLDLYYSTSPAVDEYAAASFAFTCNDGGWPRDPETYWRDLTRSRPTQPIFGPNISPCAYWHKTTTEKPLVIGNDVPLLIVQAERDDIPVVWAERLHRKLTGSHLVTVDRRAHGVYDTRVPCVVTTVNGYLATGRLPTDRC